MYFTRGTLCGGYGRPLPEGITRIQGPCNAEPTPAPLLVTVSLRALGLEASVPIMMNTQNGTHYMDPRDPTV